MMKATVLAENSILISFLAEYYFQVGIQKIFDGEFVPQCEYYVVVFEDFVEFIIGVFINGKESLKQKSQNKGIIKTFLPKA